MVYMYGYPRYWIDSGQLVYVTIYRDTWLRGFCLEGHLFGSFLIVKVRHIEEKVKATWVAQSGSRKNLPSVTPTRPIGNTSIQRIYNIIYALYRCIPYRPGWGHAGQIFSGPRLGHPGCFHLLLNVPDLDDEEAAKEVALQAEAPKPCIPIYGYIYQLTTIYPISGISIHIYHIAIYIYI